MRGTCPTAYSPETTTTAGIYTCRYSVDQTGLSLAMPTGGMASSIQLAPAGGRQRRDMAQELADWLAASEGSSRVEMAWLPDPRH